MTLKRETRAQWGARPPKNRRYDVTPKGVAVHYPGSPGSMRGQTHEQCRALLRGWQTMHMNRGSNDLEYGSLICQHGVWMEARTEFRGDLWRVRVGSNGTAAANTTHTSVQLMIGTADRITDQEKRWLAEAIAELRRHGWGPDVKGHRDFYATACPGDSIYRALPDISAMADRWNEETSVGDYQHHTGKRDIPAGTWVTINEVDAIRQGPALYVTQFAMETLEARLLRVRFSRNGKDGTGDQTYRLRPRSVWNTTHLHAVAVGFDGTMQVQIKVNRPVRARYRIAKSIKL